MTFYDHESDIRDLVISIKYKLAELYTKKLKKEASANLLNIMEELDKIIYNADMVTTQKNNLIQDNTSLIKAFNQTKEGSDDLVDSLEDAYDDIEKLRETIKKIKES